MPTIPAGSPAWLRTAAIAQYGGDANKRNYLSQGVVDAQTDLGAEEHARMVADMAALSRVASMANVTYLNNDSSSAAPTIETVYMMTGVRIIAYAGSAAPTGFPSAVRNGPGDVTFTFASSYSDDYGVSGAFALNWATGGGHGTAFCNVTTEVLSATTVRVRCFSHDGTALSNARVTLEVG
jgi:hypothetical protein